MGEGRRRHDPQTNDTGGQTPQEGMDTMKDTDRRRIMEATAAKLPEVLLDILETPPKRRRG